VTGGFRYTNDKVSFHQDPLSTLYNPTLTHQENSVSKPSWTASLDYRFTPSLLAYATTRGSWRAGGYNYTVFPLNATAAGGGNAFNPETTKDVEVGLKYSGHVAGVPVTFNTDFYNQWVSNIQRAAYVPGPGGSPTLLTANVPNAQVSGVEGDFTIRPLSWFLLGLSGAYTNARFTNGQLTILGTNFSYGPYADAPKATGSLYAEVSQILGNDAGTIRLRGDIYGQTNFYFSNIANTSAPGTDIPGYSLTNMRLTWSDLMGTKLTAAVYVRNLFDKAYYTGGNATGPNLGINVVDPGLTRMYGGELRYQF
jgi:iron complex outermembrane receptor protein